MASVSREKIALVVFVLLVLFGIGLLIAYLNIGHNWNVTAAQIDDATGELEGYTVILYAGTVEEPAEEESSASGKGESAGSIDAVEPSTSTSAESAESTGQARDLEGDGASRGASGLEPSASSADAAAGSDEPSGSRASGGATPLFSSPSMQERDPVSVDDVAASYRDKDAQVLVIDVENLSAYQEGTILKRGDRRIGVFSVAFNEPLPRVQAKVDALRAARVDFVVAITPDRQFVESATGIDIALSMTDEGSSFLGGTVNGTFYVDSPLVGQVGAVLVSPHNVVSAKDVTEP